MTTFNRLSAILAKDYKLDAASLGKDTSLESLGIDSLGVADMLFNVEDEFKISLPPEPVNLLTIGDVAGYIDNLIALQADPASTGAATTPLQPAAPASNLS